MKLEILTEVERMDVVTLENHIIEEFKPIVINPYKISGYYYPDQFTEFLTVNLWFDGNLITVKETPELTHYLRNNLDTRKRETK